MASRRPHPERTSRPGPFRCPRWSPQNRPMVVTSKAANGPYPGQEVVIPYRQPFRQDLFRTRCTLGASAFSRLPTCFPSAQRFDSFFPSSRYWDENSSPYFLLAYKYGEEFSSPQGGRCIHGPPPGEVAALVRQLRGPHFSRWPWCRRRSSMALTAATSPRSLPQSSTGRLEVNSVLARS
jgi:hypothetical protein